MNNLQVLKNIQLALISLCTENGCNVPTEALVINVQTSNLNVDKAAAACILSDWARPFKLICAKPKQKQECLDSEMKRFWLEMIFKKNYLKNNMYSLQISLTLYCSLLLTENNGPIYDFEALLFFTPPSCPATLPSALHSQ